MINLGMDSYQPVKLGTDLFAVAFYDSQNPESRLKWSEPLSEKEFRERLTEMGMNPHQVDQHVQYAVPRHISQT